MLIDFIYTHELYHNNHTG